MPNLIRLLSLVITTATFLSASQISSYPELTSAIREGNRFVIVLDAHECTGKSGMPIGYFHPQAMMLLPATETSPGRVVTSHLHFTDHSGKPMYEYVKYTFHSDNAVTVQTTFYNPQDFQLIGAAHTFDCSLGKGVEIHSEKLPCQ